MLFRSLHEPLPHYNYSVCFERSPLCRTYSDLESVCIYYKLTHDHKYRFPFTKVSSIAINLYIDNDATILLTKVLSSFVNLGMLLLYHFVKINFVLSRA
jgi:hypothetical protein